MPVTVIRDMLTLRTFDTSRWQAPVESPPFAGLAAAMDWLAMAGAEPFVIVVTDDRGRLLALATWCLRADRLGVMHVTGVGALDAWSHDPWFLDAGATAKSCEAIVEALLGARRQWAYVSLNLSEREGALLHDRLQSAGPVVMTSFPHRDRYRVTMDVPPPGVLDHISGKSRKEIRRLQRKLDTVPHRFFRADDGESGAYVDWLCEQQAARWPELRDWGPYHAYMRALVDRARETGQAEVYVLEIEAQPAAVLVAIRHGQHVYELLATYDPGFKTYSPGIMLDVWTLEAFQAGGTRLVDFGPGLQDYKAQMQNDCLRMVDVRLAVSPIGYTGMIDVVVGRLKRVPMLRRAHAQLGLMRAWLRGKSARREPASSMC